MQEPTLYLYIQGRKNDTVHVYEATIQSWSVFAVTADTCGLAFPLYVYIYVKEQCADYMQMCCSRIATQAGYLRREH